jgi:hypothetical protein
MISYVLEVSSCSKGVISVLSDDTDVFVLLAYWCIGWTCIAKYRWSGGMAQCRISILPALT